MRTLLIVSALALLVASTALATPRAGVAVPLAEVLPPGTFDVQLQAQGTEMLQARGAKDVLGTQLGLPYGFEVGLDLSVGGHQNGWHLAGAREYELGYDPALKGWNTVWFNVKKQLVAEKMLSPAVSIGMINLGSTPGVNFWITAGKHFAGLDASVGVSDVSDDQTWYEAFSYQPNPKWKFIAEHLGGGTMSTNFAVEHRFYKNWTSAVGWMRANDHFHDDALFLRATYTNSFLW